jgi:3-phosphoshikimate 1-carboxyvinyltransferase
MSGIMSDELTITGGVPLRGRVRLPGCKGISHRALIFAALGEGTSSITNLAPGADVANTAQALAALGVQIRADGERVEVNGGGFGGIHEPDDVVDCGNSGTTLRLLAGLLAGRPFLSVLTGDGSLRQRPMARVVQPLRALGALVDGAADGTRAPLVVRGGGLVGEQLRLEVASGQVKTALVLAGLQADGTTEIVEPEPSRDHTERMLDALGAPIERVDDRTLMVRAGAPRSFDLEVPGDPSSAAFFVVAAAVVPGSAVVVESVSLNPGRVEYLDVLREMGARIDARVTGEVLGEPVGDITVEAAPLRGTAIVSREAIVDELPVLAVAAAFADGVTEIRDATELAVKESNRITTLQQELSRLGVAVEPRADGLVVRGGKPRGAHLTSHGDHRIAMAAAVAAAGAEGESTVWGWEAVAVSYPGFAEDLASLRDDG